MFESYRRRRDASLPPRENANLGLRQKEQAVNEMAARMPTIIIILFLTVVVAATALFMSSSKEFKTDREYYATVCKREAPQDLTCVERRLQAR